MRAGRLFVLALQNKDIKSDERAELLGWIRENYDFLPDVLEDLKLSRLDLDGMEKDFLSIGGTKL